MSDAAFDKGIGEPAIAGATKEAAAIKRTTDAKPEHVASRIITARLDLRQAGLFDLPDTDRAALPPSPRETPAGLNWLHEVEHDGYRTFCSRSGAVSVYPGVRKNWADCQVSPEPSRP